MKVWNKEILGDINNNKAHIITALRDLDLEDENSTLHDERKLERRMLMT